MVPLRLAYPLHRESLSIFQELDHRRGVARLLECFACSAAVQLQAERSLRLAGAAAALEFVLDPARQVLTNTIGATAWLEGWATPVEKAIEEVLMSEAASSAS
jgi:hypothetical protein